MRVAFDTSAIVAGSIAGHVHEARAAIWFDAALAGRFEAGTTCHALAETWATLTALPLDVRVDPSLAERLIQRFAQRVTPLQSSWSDYLGAIARCAERKLRSGSVYDAMHLVTAERWGADLLITFNAKHFERLVGVGSPRLLVPPDPPSLAGLEQP